EAGKEGAAGGDLQRVDAGLVQAEAGGLGEHVGERAVGAPQGGGEEDEQPAAQGGGGAHAGGAPSARARSASGLVSLIPATAVLLRATVPAPRPSPCPAPPASR